MANNGKWLEQAVDKALKAFQAEKPSFYHRFYDTTSAGGFLPAQPGDYFWLLPNTPAILLEVKSTEKSAPLRSLIKPGQGGKHRLWHRSGHRSAFIYGDKVSGLLEWYWGEAVLSTGTGELAPGWRGELQHMRDMFYDISISTQ